jgi:hypothetical protein
MANLSSTWNKSWSFFSSVIKAMASTGLVPCLLYEFDFTGFVPHACYELILFLNKTCLNFLGKL